VRPDRSPEHGVERLEALPGHPDLAAQRAQPAGQTHDEDDENRQRDKHEERRHNDREHAPRLAGAGSDRLV